MNSTVATIKHRKQTIIANNPEADVSRDAWNDSEIIASAAPDGATLVRDSSNTDGYGFSIRPQFIGLGGGRIASLPLASGWSNVNDWLDISLDNEDYGGLNIALKVEVRVDNAADPVTPRLFNVTAAVAAATGVASSATAADYSGVNQKQSISVFLASGVNVYRLQGNHLGNFPVYVIGYLQIGG